MNKVFYLLKINCKESYTQLCAYINALYTDMISSLLESRFQYEKIGCKDGLLVSISEEDTTKHNYLLSKLNIEYEIKDLKKEYENWVESHTCHKEQLDDGFLDDNSIDCFLECQIPRIVDYDDGTQSLTEEEIKRKDGIKLYTHSRENCGHHTPHIHVWYNDDKNYCSISLTDYTILAPSNCNSAKCKKCIDLLKTCTTEAKEAWNRTSGKIKFKVVNGEITNMTYDSSKKK